MRILVFDTCAIIKNFISEPGSVTVRWLVLNRAQYALNITVSTIARLEFECALWKKAANGQLTIPQTRGILKRARGYFKDAFRVRDTKPIPSFLGGRPLEYAALVKKYGLKVGKNDRDIWHLMYMHNYLRCFGGISKPHMVTSDSGLITICKLEGYGIIDPIKQDPALLEKAWKGIIP